MRIARLDETALYCHSTLTVIIGCISLTFSGWELRCRTAEKTRPTPAKLNFSILNIDFVSFFQVAVNLSALVNADPPCPPSERLLHIVSLGLEQEAAMRNAENKSKPVLPVSESANVGPGLDLEIESEVLVTAAEPALYETAYVTSHKGNCRAGAFNSDGSLCATGSADASIKV